MAEKKLCRDAFLKDAQLRILCHDRDAAKDASATVKNVRLSTVVCKKVFCEHNCQEHHLVHLYVENNGKEVQWNANMRFE